MVQDISLENIPSQLTQLLAGLAAEDGNAGARALSAALSLHQRATKSGSARDEAERLRRIADCCGDLAEQHERQPRSL